MLTSEINWLDDIINSSDIIARQEDLANEEESLKATVAELEEEIEALAGENLSTSDLYMLDRKNDDLTSAMDDLEAFYVTYGDEIEDLNDAINAGEDSPDWLYGETLISEDYFEEYIKDQINDCYEMPDEFDSGKWPWNHMVMDWEAAADEAKGDYNEIIISSQTFLIRA